MIEQFLETLAVVKERAVALGERIRTMPITAENITEVTEELRSLNKILENYDVITRGRMKEGWLPIVSQLQKDSRVLVEKIAKNEEYAKVFSQLPAKNRSLFIDANKELYNIRNNFLTK